MRPGAARRRNSGLFSPKTGSSGPGFFTLASLAVGLAMLVRSHSDQAMLSSFFITPMAFLGGTFFPVDRLPEWAQAVLVFLQLTHAARVIRAAIYGEVPDLTTYLILALIGATLFWFAVVSVNKSKD